jgi:Uma2 family endonuclease
MTALVPPPDHTQLPASDGTMAQSFLEHPQSMLLTDSIWPVLQQRHPDGQYAIGRDCGIYWRRTDPPLDGCKAPDWFYIPNVPPMLDGQIRRSYVLWQEIIAPLVILEFVSGDGSEERDRTANRGKFWVYEQAVRAPYYAIYEVDPGRVEVYRLVNGSYALVPANERGHYPIMPLAVELGIWQGRYLNLELPWLRWWDARGNLLLTQREWIEQDRLGTEYQRREIDLAQRQADQERQQKQAQRQADQERQRAERLAARLRELGVEPEGS